MRLHLTALALSLFALATPMTVRAGWPLDGAPLCTAPNSQNLPMAVSDGAGGAIITWYDARTLANGADIYVQRVNAFGVPLWTADGVAICTSGSNQINPNIVSDGAGGAIVTWQDNRAGINTDIYAQRVNASGAPQWLAGGAAICTAAIVQIVPVIVADGVGGAIIAWQDYRTLPSSDIYAQRVNSLGATQWTVNGVAVCTAANMQQNPVVASDGSSGAIVTWEDTRSGQYIWAQRVNSTGAPVWAANGVAMSTVGGAEYSPRIVVDGAGGAIVAWQDNRSGVDVYAQRVNSLGTTIWTANGVGVCTAVGFQYEPALVADGAGGAIITWRDDRSGTADIYAQHMGALGDNRWVLDGVALSTATADQKAPVIASDGADGAIVVWADTRNGNNDLYAQQVNGAGNTRWTTNGTVVSTAANDQLSPAIVASSTGGSLVAWNDIRKSTDYDIYAQRIEPRYGYWGHPEGQITSVADVRGDQGGKVKVNWTASDWDVLDLRTISYYSVWRATDPVAAANAIASNASLLVNASDVSPQFTGPAFRLERTPTTSYYWELMGTQSAEYFDGYRFSAATSADSTSQGSSTQYFQVLSHTADAYTFWVSNVLSGHSVDNLAPTPPLLLTAQRIGSYVYLKWNGVHVPDLKNYSVYRQTSTGVTPVPINFLSSANDTVLTDTSAPVSGLYYIVTAYDVHANQSAPSNEAHVSATTGVGNTPPITALSVLDNMPNPFNDKTTLRVGLPKASEVEIDVFDVAGRSVRSERTSTLAAGWRDISFDAHDGSGQSLPSGVYFYRVKAAGQTITRKMVIAR